MPKQVKARGKAAPPPTPDYAATGSVKAQAIKLAAQQAQLAAAFKPKAGTVYIRNIRGIQARVTLDSGRRIELAPRGQIDDLAPISKEEQADSKFIINAGILYEVITVKQASEVLSKQAINAQTPRRNPLFDHLVNAEGDPIEDVNIVAAQEDPIITRKIVDGSDTAHTTGNTELIETPGPEEVAVPGSRLNPGPSLPADISAEDIREFIAWREAQQLRESLTVTIEDTQTEADSVE